MKHGISKKQIKPFFGIFGACVICFFSASGLFSQNLQPQLEIESPTFDFGTVPVGSLVSHDFIIRNIGKAVLEIENVSPT